LVYKTDGIYFITITCYKWISLLQVTNAYDAVYKWFDYLKEKGHYITEYVIMLITFMHLSHLLKKLSDAVEIADKKRGKLHEVFEDSFDVKECMTQKFIKQKLDYIHNDPCSGNARPTGSSGRGCLLIVRKIICMILQTLIL
jgi:hypothetical protein